MGPPPPLGWSCKTLRRRPSFRGTTPTTLAPPLAPVSLTRFRASGLYRTLTSSTVAEFIYCPRIGSTRSLISSAVEVKNTCERGQEKTRAKRAPTLVENQVQV